MLRCVTGKTTTFMSVPTGRSIKDRQERIRGNPPEDHTTQNRTIYCRSLRLSGPVNGVTSTNNELYSICIHFLGGIPKRALLNSLDNACKYSTENNHSKPFKSSIDLILPNLDVGLDCTLCSMPMVAWMWFLKNDRGNRLRIFFPTTPDS